MTAVDSERRLLAIDAMRGAAALAVVLLHVRHSPDAPTLLRTLALAPINMAYLGVPMFIVVSGFCIHLSATRDGLSNVRWIDFWKRRFFRLYPPYLAAILLSLILFFAFPNPRPHVGAPIASLLPDLALHLAMIHNLFPAFQAGGGNAAFWSLGLEEQLYALFALFVIAARRFGVAFCTVIGVSITVVWRVVTFVHEANPMGEGLYRLGNWYSTWPPSFWGMWVLGALAAELYRGRLQLPEWCFSKKSLLSLLASAILLNRMTLGLVLDSPTVKGWLAERGASACLRFVSLAVPLADMAFAGAVFVMICRYSRPWCQLSNGKLQRALAWVGSFSYSLYLVHVPIILALETQLTWNSTIADVVLRYSITIPLVLGVAYVFYALVERPSLNYSSFRRRTRSTAS